MFGTEEKKTEEIFMIVRTESGFENVRLPESAQGKAWVFRVCRAWEFDNLAYFQSKERQTINKLYFKAVLDSQKKGAKIYRVPFIVYSVDILPSP